MSSSIADLISYLLTFQFISFCQKQKTRNMLNSKIKQLNTAIDNVSTRLKDNVAARFKSVTEKAPTKTIDDGDMKYGV